MPLNYGPSLKYHISQCASSINQPDSPDRRKSEASKYKRDPMNIVNQYYSTNLNEQDVSDIEWSNLIFLPFHPVFRLLVLCSVIVKSTLGPLQAIYPTAYCWDMMGHNTYLTLLKTFYWYGADSIYGCDTLLHIIHRQVTDKAMRREYAPKSAFLLLLDLLSLIPFYALMVTDFCPRVQLWPNLLAYNEFLIVYRIWEYFSLRTTHSYFRLILGFTIIMAITTNCVTTFWILLTYEGLCSNCSKDVLDYDWRAYVQHKMNETDMELSTYVYALSFVYTHAVRVELDNTLPSTILEFIMICLFMLSGYMLENIIVIPKAFAESVLRLRRISVKYRYVQKIIEETKRRNTSEIAYKHVEMYYTTMWSRRSGIVHMPEIMDSIPRYLKLEVIQDLIWPLFYHSPTLRKTSNVFKRWLSETMYMSYKLPGERFYSGRQCLSNLYYVKSGIIQLISTDDGSTPILSFTSGTIFGDINFILPHRNWKAVIRCLTYCEVYYLTRANILKALYRFPEDRKIIINSYNDRLKHAKILISCKNQIRGHDKNENEGIIWIRKRWWELFDTIDEWKKKTVKKESQLFSARCELPHEESPYHCAKYLGQLVLCTETQLQTKSMFIQDRFPWIISPYSEFSSKWKTIVTLTVFLSLFIYPPHIIKCNVPQWFQFVLFWIDVVYTVDLLVTLSTAMTTQENESPNFASIMFERCKSLNYILDIVSAVWLEDIMVVINQPQLYYSIQFNRMIKIYVLFSSNYIKWNIHKNPLIDICRNITLAHFTFLIILSHIVYEINDHCPQLTTNYFFGTNLCSRHHTENCEPVQPFLGVTLPWIFELIFPEVLPLKQIDIYIAIATAYMAYILYAYCKSRFLSYLYLKYIHVINYEYFVMNIKKYYQRYGIHKDLLRRLERYLICQYKYYKGIDIMYPISFKHEPFEIYWKVQGEVAERIISKSKAFKYADPAFIRELACAAKCTIFPRNATLYVFGSQCKNITWVIQGYIRSEFHDDYGEIIRKIYEPGEMISTFTVCFGKVALKTYISYTDCEILYIKTQDFLDIYKRYPLEWHLLESTMNELGPQIEEVFRTAVINQREHQVKLREKLLNSKISTSLPRLDQNQSRLESKRVTFILEGAFWSDPESLFMQIWLLFRAITVFISIANASLRGGISPQEIWSLKVIGIFCDCIAWIDIILKLFLSYYDQRGLLITAKSSCSVNYLTKGFLLDIIGALPWFEIIRSLLIKSISYGDALFINTCCKCLHIYIVFAYFHYISDLPTVNAIYITIIKWQFVNILIVMCASQYLLLSCIDYTLDNKMELDDVIFRNECWIPRIFTLPQKLDSKSLHFLFVQSLNLAECGMLRMSLGGFVVNRENYGLYFVLFVLGLVFWVVTCYTVALLVLSNRSNRLFQHRVNHLKTFLLNERVDKNIINKTLSHFQYSWMRSKGVNTEQMTNECIGVVFQQDLSYFFYKKTYSVLDTLLIGGEAIQRQLAGISTLKYFLPGDEIMREMDLMPDLYVVHRGKVNLTKDGQKVITLTKGDIFGQLTGTRLRPVRISAVAEEYVDVLQINVQSFQKIITDEVRENIANNALSRNDFMATRTLFIEDPYDTIEYILRGTKTIQLPWMYEPIEAKYHSWYAWWLHLTWLCSPFVTAIIVFLLPWAALPPEYVSVLYNILIILDVLHVGNFIAEYYSINLIVDDNKCVQRIIGFGLLRYWGFYLDALSLVIPLLTLIDDDPRFQLAKLLRLKWFIDFEYHFCQGFKSNIAPRVLRGAIIFLLLHFCACLWIYVACSEDKFPLSVPDFEELNATIDYAEWIHPDKRKGGCARTTRPIVKKGNELLPTFVVPAFWAYDYVLAMTFIILIHTRTSLNTIMALTTNQVYYKLLVTFVMYILDMWLLSVSISSIYTRFRELYQYDYQVRNLMTFLKDSGLYPTLSRVLRKYTKQLWRKHKGNWLPELVYQGPICLREDLFVELYLHHLDAPSTFRQLPFYFKRQLAARLERMVIFPGKCIVHEGDVLNVTYFIHEGEVEKWYNDEAGEGKMMSLLHTNGYFGSMPGLLVNSAFQFSYYTRTVVDLVYLSLQKWEDLLEGYPEIKKSLYKSTQALKYESLKVSRNTGNVK